MKRITKETTALDKTVKLTVAVLVLVMAGALLFESAPTQARGRKPADVFKKQIILADRPFPPRFKSDKHFITYMKKVRTNQIWPDKKDGSWHVEYMAFFEKPLAGGIYSVLFYDITEADRPELVGYEGTSSASAGERIMSGAHELDPKYFKVDHTYLMLYTPGPNEPALAEVEFVLSDFNPQKAASARAKRDQALKAARKADKDEELKAKGGGKTWNVGGGF